MNQAREVNGMPPIGQAIPLGLQHVLAMFAGNVTVPIIIAGVIGADGAEKAFLIQAALLAAGLATLIQTLGVGPVGARLPIVQGTSFAFLPILIPLAKTHGMAAVIGAGLLNGVIQIVLGFFAGRLRHLFPPLVTGVVVIAIGMSLVPVGIHYAGGGRWLMDNKPELWASGSQLFLAFLVIVVTLLVHQFGRGFWSASAVFVGLVVGYLVAIPMGMVNLDGVAGAAWMAIPEPLHYGVTLPTAAILGMILMALVTTVETVGDTNGVTMGGANREATKKEISGAITGDGVGTIIGAFFNALPNTSYSQNVGLVALTGMMSRFVVAIGAVFLILAGLVPKFSTIVSAMPQAVLGGGAIIMFGMVLTAGFKLLSEANLNRRNMLIVALSLGLGLGMAQVPAFVRIVPESIGLLLTSGIIPCGLLALFLNMILPEEQEDD